MRRLALALTIALFASRAVAEPCRDAPPPETSAERSISDVPYAMPEARPAPCPPSAAASDVGRESWAADGSETKRGFSRAGMFGVAFGTMLMVTGAAFAACAKHPVSGQSASFCHDGTAPLLIVGGASTVLGLGSLAVATWVIKDDPATASPGRSGLSAGLSLRLSLDFAQR
ncbi:MAG: hypothetical protein JST54_23885 [Deltaproteobacteria bacterium]|nr:hypothetical protein [Deltaproteobacteria bacterium]